MMTLQVQAEIAQCCKQSLSQQISTPIHLRDVPTVDKSSVCPQGTAITDNHAHTLTLGMPVKFVCKFSHMLIFNILKGGCNIIT